MEKIILTDCDGVLLRWNEGFENFAEQKGYPKVPGTDTEYSMSLRHNITMKQALALIKEYNESDAMTSLLPFADSVEYVKKLAAKGFRFIAVTSLSDHPDAKTYRTENLKSLFGDVFDDVVCLSMGASKANVLMQWADSGYFWIEDHMRQAEAGHEAGLRTVLINHPYNHHYNTDLFPVVSYETPWKEIYNMVCNTYNEAIAA
jgi:FMN phosphatase YigB (HAD superfamily)